MRFLCLHGRGTSAKIFEMQTARIREELDEHEFVFLNGDISVKLPGEGDGNGGAAAAGSEEDLDGDLYGYFGELDDVSQYQALVEGLMDVVESQGPFDGIMGFSEGGIVAATLLLEDARRPFANFKCGIFFSAAPPLDPDDLRAGSVRSLDPVQDRVSVHVPTAHIYSPNTTTTATTTSPNGTGAAGGGGGTTTTTQVESPLRTLWAEAGWTAPEQVHDALARLCDCDNRQVSVHDQGHQVPGPRDQKALRGALRAIDRTIKSAEEAED